MLHTLRIATVLLACVAALALDGCGGSSEVARVQGAHEGSITTTVLDHWMQALAGADFHASTGAEGPQGLVSEPADYKRCIVAAKLVAPRSFFNQLRPTGPELKRECRLLHGSIKAQALSFLIAARWTIAEAAERGVTVSAGDVQRELELAGRRLYPTEQRLRRYLTERHWSLADLLYELKLEALATRLGPQPVRRLTDAALDGRPRAALASQREQRLIARTQCAPGYVVPGCSGYRGPPSPAPTPVAIIKNLVHNPQ